MIRNLSLLPPNVSAERVTACIALISDTHQYPGIDVLSESLMEMLQGVDLVLHAGDCGDIAVLDKLSQIAPVIAVHGNDDSAEADATLPYTQVIRVKGERILLWHSHFQNIDEEYAARAVDAWEPKLEYLAGFGKQFGTNMVVYGHSHIPMTRWYNGVLLINPGAAGMGTAVDRTINRTVGLLFLRDEGAPVVMHFSATAPHEPRPPHIDYDAGFSSAWIHNCQRVVDPAMGKTLSAIRPIVFRALRPVREALLRLVTPRWLDPSLPLITIGDVLAEIADDLAIPADVRGDLCAALEAALAQNVADSSEIRIG